MRSTYDASNELIPSTLSHRPRSTVQTERPKREGNTHDAPGINAWQVDLAFKLDDRWAVRVRVWAVDGETVDSVFVGCLWGKGDRMTRSAFDGGCEVRNSNGTR